MCEEFEMAFKRDSKPLTKCVGVYGELGSGSVGFTYLENAEETRTDELGKQSLHIVQRLRHVPLKEIIAKSPLETTYSIELLVKGLEWVEEAERLVKRYLESPSE